MPVRIIESGQNARVKELRKALAQPDRGAQGPMGIEGPKMLEEALRAGLRVKTVFVAHGSLRQLEALHVPAGTQILEVPRKILDAALATETPQPVAALVEPPAWSWESLLGVRQGGAPLVLVLAGLQDPGNLGTILRSAEAFGASGVVSLPGTVSAWNPKAVRASAGSVFRVPVLAASAEDCFARLREAGVRVWTAAARGAEPADGVDLAVPGALMIGNEGNGVPQELAMRSDSTIMIPCPGPVESLNAAVAASVLLYEASRQRASSASHPFSGAPGRAGKWMGKQSTRTGQRRSAAKKPARRRR
jgi:RNA methyltransferase, TrmH family